MIGTEQRIAELAAGQHGVISRRQLLEAGSTPSMIRTWLRSKRLVPLHRGVYLLGALVGPLEPGLAREMAAVMACGAGALPSHRSAGWMHELLIPPPDRKRRSVEVTIPGDVRRRRPGIVVYRTGRLGPGDVSVVSGIRVTSPCRTLRDLSGVLGPRELERAAARALRRELVGQDELAKILEDHDGRPGAIVLRAALSGEAGPHFTRSPAEDLLLEIVESGGIQRPEANVVVCGHEVDFLWRDVRVIVEVDGYRYHRSRRAFDNDRSRDTHLTASGYQVLRFTWRQLVEERERTLAALTAVLTLAQARRGA